MRSSFVDAVARHAKPDAAELDKRNRESGLASALRLYPQDPDLAALTGPTAWIVFEGGIPRIKAYDGGQKLYVSGGGVSPDRGDRDATLLPEDADLQYFSTTLTANRTVSPPPAGQKGRRIRVVRDAATAGAFTLAVGTLKTIPASTRAFVEIVDDGSAYRLAGYGTL